MSGCGKEAGGNPCLMFSFSNDRTELLLMNPRALRLDLSAVFLQFGVSQNNSHPHDLNSFNIHIAET